MKRFLPRFSLLTAVVMMFAAGGLIWLNLRHDSPLDFAHTDDDSVTIYVGKALNPRPSFYRGWPFHWENRGGKTLTISTETPWAEALKRINEASQRPVVDYKSAAFDLAIALAMLAVVGVVSEFIVRRVYRSGRTAAGGHQ